MSEKAIPLSQLKWEDYLAKKNYNKDPEKMCDLCIKEQKRKYGAVTIKCDGLATTPAQIKKAYGKSLGSGELELIEQIYNPYLWGIRNIKSGVLSHRWYQELATRCTAKNEVFRWGRRSGKSRGLALKALHKIAINPGTKVLMLAPQEVHVKEFAEILDSYVYGFREEFTQPHEFRIGSRQKPYYEIRYSNGSRFRGIIAATDATTVRGQSADIIILDEVDYISEEALKAIVAIKMDNPNVEIWVASTPSGKRTLYRYEQDPLYKSWHFPSFVIPHYNSDLDDEMKTEYGSGIGYVHEVMAEYGEDEAGVFQNYFIEQCIDPNPPEDRAKKVLKNRSQYMITLGVDWNDDKIGTRLIATAFDKKAKKFFKVEAETVSRDGWTQVDATQKLIDLNRKYKFDKIYLDEGFGVSTIQFIKRYAQDQYGKVGWDHPDLRLADVVGINFSQSIEIRDVETQQPIKKDMKSFLVENTIRYLERLAYIFDKDLDKDLIDQMANYVVLRISPNGKKIYGAHDSKIGDHDLDAFMLSMLAFTLEYQELEDSVDSTGIAYTVSKEELDSDGALFTGGPNLVDPERDNSLLFESRSKNSDNSKLTQYVEKHITRSNFGRGGGISRGQRSSFKNTSF